MGQDTNLNKASTDERIDPATEQMQQDLLEEFARNSGRSTNDIKFQKVTIGAANTTKDPEAHGCRSVKIWTASTTVLVGDSDGQDVLLIQNVWLEIPINNCGNLRFKGSAGAEVIYIISSN